MSSANFFNTMDKAFDLRTKVLTNKATYTVKVGSVSDNFVVDRVIEVVTTASGNNLVITVPNGEYPGQKLLIILKTLGDDETVTVTTTTGDDCAMSAAGDFVSLEWIDDTVSGWQIVHSQVD
jgi:hypothetical protein